MGSAFPACRRCRSSTLSACEEAQQVGLSGPLCWRIDEENHGEAYSQSIYALKQWTEKLDGPTSRVVLLVSAHPAAGCSTVAAQLALYAANAGTRTILVDADLRSCALTSRFAPIAKSTLADALVNGNDAKAAISKVTDTALSFCPAPPEGSCRPLDILGARSVRGFFRTLREDFDLVIVDTPPLAAYVDATALVPYADGILIVVKSQTEQADVLALLDQLQVGPETGVGIVLNMTKPGQKN